MTLETFVKEKNAEPKPNVENEWNGKDFRGEKCKSRCLSFVNAHPKVLEWLKDLPRNSIELGSRVIRALCEFSNLTPEQFLELDKKTARDKAWQYLSSFKMQHPGKALIHKGWIKSFYLYHNEEPLVFIPTKHKIVYEPSRVKYRMSKDVCWRIIHKAKTLRDEAILLFGFESGLRRNALTNLNVGHYKNFLWFKKTNDEELINSNEREGNIAVFRVMARPTKQFTWDKKLRGKGINWYYGCLHKEATKILKQYVAHYHQDSQDDMPLWYPHKNKTKRLCAEAIYDMIKGCIRRAFFPTDQINFHSLRRGFRSVVRNTTGITDNEFKEAIMGHKLKGSQENYFDKDPLEFAKNYAYCDFSEPQPEKDKALTQSQKEIERLREENRKIKEAMEKAQVTTEVNVKPLTIPSGPLGGSPPIAKEPSYEEPKRQFQQAKTRVPQTEPKTSSLAAQKSDISMKPSVKDDWVWCPDKDDWVRKSVECKKCGSTNFKKFADCYAARNRIRIGKPTEQDRALFTPTKPKPNL